MSNIFRETSSQSWFGRLKGALFGMLFGLALFLISFPFLFWNEGRAVERYKTLQEGAGIVLPVDATSRDLANEGRLIYISGTAATTERLSDPVLGISENAIRLGRNVEMFQWWESTSKETREKFGGGTETVTTYEYQQVWSDQIIDSNGFKQPQGHQNPGRMPLSSETWQASWVLVGEYRLSSSLIGSISGEEALPVGDGVTIPASLGGSARLDNGGIHAGDPQNPAIGDIRVNMTIVRPADVSIIAAQRGETLAPFQANAGGTIQLLSMGLVSPEEMFKAAELRNKLLTWALRFGGFLMMFVGLRLLFGLLRVGAALVPFVGRIVGAGIGFVSALMAGSLSLITIAIAWVFYRPLLGLALLAVAAIVGWFLISRVRKADVVLPDAEATTNG
jgi:transmembrane protein TMEM43